LKADLGAGYLALCSKDHAWLHGLAQGVVEGYRSWVFRRPAIRSGRVKKKPIGMPKFVNEAEEADWWASRQGREFVKQK
jgi:hypothetical protein